MTRTTVTCVKFFPDFACQKIIKIDRPMFHKAIQKIKVARLMDHGVY